MLSAYFWQHSGMSEVTLSSLVIQDVAGLAQKIKNVSFIGLKRIALLLAVG